MSHIGDSERATQNRVIRFFCDELHYTYLGNLHDTDNSNIMQERLLAGLLRRGYSEKLAKGAIDTLVKTAGNLQQGPVLHQQGGLFPPEIRCKGKRGNRSAGKDGIFYRL
jgi:hypothetical protein